MLHSISGCEKSISAEGINPKAKLEKSNNMSAQQKIISKLVNGKIDTKTAVFFLKLANASKRTK